jgi:hypothetical protein
MQTFLDAGTAKCVVGFLFNNGTQLLYYVTYVSEFESSIFLQKLIKYTYNKRKRMANHY